LGEPEQADALLAPLRALDPVNDTVQRIPTTALSHMHMDPEHPVPGTGDGMLLQALPPEAVDELIRTGGAGSSSPLLSLELRQLGGGLARARPQNGALAALEAEYALYAVGIAPTPEAAAAVGRHVEIVKDSMSPWAARQMYLNFAETRRDPGTLWTEQAHRRLRRIKAAVDPTGRIRANHPLA
ncbi:MAG: hypothetical protein ACXVFK_12705, partial [Solirubrobacteraceae bacterium]